MPEGVLRFLTLAALVAIHLGLAGVIGSAFSQLWLDGPPSPWTATTNRQARAMRRAGLAMGLIAIAAVVWFEAAAMSETGLLSSGPTLGALLAHTHFGHAWFAGLAAWLLTGGLLFRADRAANPRGPLFAALLAWGVFAFTRSVVSHAGSQGDLTVDVAVDWLHLVLACMWVGIVAAGARLRLPGHACTKAERQAAVQWVARMSSTATAVLAGIVATGAFKVGRGVAVVGSFEAYVGSNYGRALVTKLLLVAAAALLGGVNRVAVLPSLIGALNANIADEVVPWRRRLVVVLRFELLTLCLVLVAAAALSSAELPAGE